MYKEMTMNDLFDLLNEIKELENKIIFENEMIYINFHSDFLVKIVTGDSFIVYINDKYYLEFEERYIDGAIMESVTNCFVMIEKKPVFKKRSFLKKIFLDYSYILDESHFFELTHREFEAQKEKWLSKEETIKIFDSEKLIYKAIKNE